MELEFGSVDDAVSFLFDHYEISEILSALASRCREEANIAYGEGSRIGGVNWEKRAADLEVLSQV
jgi:hypothetical protein